MSEQHHPVTSAGDPLDAIIAEYVQQVEAGAVPDREALLARHPDLADRLRAFFADCDRLDRQAADLRLSADPNRTTDFGSPPAEQHLGNRYGRRFANHWEFVRFAKEQQLDLDFTTPPTRPARP